MSKTAFDLRRIKAVAFDVDGVLSPSTVPLDSHGVPCRMANLKDGFALREAVKSGLRIAIISGAVAPGIKERYAMLGIENVWLGAGNKIDVFTKWVAQCNLTMNDVAFVGDDVPDCGCLRLAALGVAPADASTDALAAANYISPVKGGYGVARDLLEQILRAQGKWPTDAPANG